MRELLVLLYLSFEFIILILWMPVLIKINKDLWSTFKQTKIPLLIFLTLSLMVQIYIVVTQTNPVFGEKNLLLILGELLVKIGFMGTLVTRIIIAISFPEITAIKFKKADTLITGSILVSLIGFFIRSWIILNSM